MADLDIDEVTSDPAYPSTWPKKHGEPAPSGTVSKSAPIARDAGRRLVAIQRDFESAGPNYPRQQVIAALEYWGIRI